VGVGLTIFWLHPNKTANAIIKTMTTLALLMLLLLLYLESLIPAENLFM
jgi:hypothetical protein